MKKTILPLLLALLTAAGALRARAAEEPQTTLLPIVMYHHISRDPARWNDYVISEAEFESDLKWLRAHGYESIGVEELLAWEHGKFTLPEKPCMITFDDGFESTSAYAEPLLQQYGFQGVAAVIGSVCEEFSALDEHDPELSNLSWDDAAAMAERGVIEVQCHTWAMHELGERRGCDRMKWETIADYRSVLSDDLHRFQTESAAHGLHTVPSVAYPYGAYCRETTETVRELGFLAAFTCTEKINRLTKTAEELYDLGRYNRPHGVSSENFFAKWEENG